LTLCLAVAITACLWSWRAAVARDAAVATDGTRKEELSKLTAKEICALTPLVARQSIDPRHRVSVMDQPCTKELAGFSGRILTDVVLTFNGDKTSARRPLDHGETCGDEHITIGCDAGSDFRRCSKDSATNEHWKLRIGLNVDGDLVRGSAAVMPYKSRHDGTTTASPCAFSQGVYTNRSGQWERAEAEPDRRR